MTNVVQLIKPTVDTVKLVEEAPVVKASLSKGYLQLANEMYEESVRLWMCCGARGVCVFHSVVRKTYGFNQKTDRITASQLKKLMTYPHDETHLSADVRALISRKILIKKGLEIGPNPYISEWDLSKNNINKGDQKRSPKEPKTVIGVTKNGQLSDQKRSTQKKDTITKDNINNICDQSPYKKSIPTKKRITKPEAFKQFYALYPENKKGGNDSTPWAKFKSLKLTENDAIAMLEWLKAKSKVDGNYSTLPSSPFALGITKFISEKIWLTAIKNTSGNSFSSAKSIVRPEDDYIPCVLPGMQQPDFEVTK